MLYLVRWRPRTPCAFDEPFSEFRNPFIKQGAISARSSTRPPGLAQCSREIMANGLQFIIQPLLRMPRCVFSIRSNVVRNREAISIMGGDPLKGLRHFDSVSLDRAPAQADLDVLDVRLEDANLPCYIERHRRCLQKLMPLLRLLG